MQIKTIKETKNLEIGSEKKHEAEKTFLLSKTFISVAKKLFCVTKILLAQQKTFSRNKNFISVAKKSVE